MSKKSDPARFTDAILESISDGVFTVDAQWNISSFNRAAELITGIKRSEAIGRPCPEVFRSSMCENDCPLRKTLANSKPVINQSGYIINKLGQRIPVSVSTAVLRDADGNIIGGAETFRDLSEVETLRQKLSGQCQLGNMVSHSPAMRKICELLPMVANSPSTVLVNGETGTGKELLARAIHDTGKQKSHPFIAINCGAIPDNLLESELFGYRKGAFTGADKDKNGLIARANHGTLFLDEIGEISPALQVRLLRFLQDHSYEPLGGSRTETSNARIIAATHRDLAAMVREGRFREDLFYRVNIIRLELPPLRMRKEDIPFLACHFIERFNRLQNKNISSITPKAMEILMDHNWPGNIRELENVIERAFVICPSNTIDTPQLPDELTGGDYHTTPPSAIGNSVKLAARQAIIAALQTCNGNRQAAAKLLNIHKTTLYRKMRSLGIQD